MEPADYSNSFLKNVKGFIWFTLDEKSEFLSIQGDVEEITGYTERDFLSGNIRIKDLATPEYKSDIEMKESIEKIYSSQNAHVEFEYRIQSKYGSIKWVREVIRIPESSNSGRKQIKGFLQDITDIKHEEEILKEMEQAELRKFHDIIKNNLEILSVLLGRQGNRFTDKEVADAFKKSQSRISSIALIHEELNKERNKNSLNIAAYLEKLSFAILDSHTSEAQNIELKFDLEPVSFEPDIAISLGIIVNELILNSLKHAFPSQGKGKILISLHKIKNIESNKTSDSNKLNKSNKNPELGRNPEMESEISDEHSKSLNPENIEKAGFILIVSDNGKGLSEDFDLWSSNTLGFQIITSLVDQLKGSIELKKDKGIKFTIKFYSHFESLPGEE
jgi:PAS domain S-box-containing protein